MVDLEACTASVPSDCRKAVHPLTCSRLRISIPDCMAGCNSSIEPRLTLSQTPRRLSDRQVYSDICYALPQSWTMTNNR